MQQDPPPRPGDSTLTAPLTVCLIAYVLTTAGACIIASARDVGAVVFLAAMNAIPFGVIWAIATFGPRPMRSGVSLFGSLVSAAIILIGDGIVAGGPPDAQAAVGFALTPFYATGAVLVIILIAAISSAAARR